MQALLPNIAYATTKQKILIMFIFRMLFTCVTVPAHV